MYLSNLKIWNFRKFGSADEIDLNKPNLNLNFNKGLNVLIGENDSGKSAIIDAIKLVLKTHSYEWIKIDDDDFHTNQNRFRIELRFDSLEETEAKNFTEWLSWEGEGAEAKPFLRIIYDVKKNTERIFPSDIRAGADSEGYVIDSEAKEYLKTTYLKPLRDAKSELVPKQNSRLSQILLGHEAFKGDEKNHYLFKAFENFNKTIEKYFKGKDINDADLTDDQAKKGLELKKEIDNYIEDFYSTTKKTDFSVAPGRLKSILEKLELSIKDEINPGLGTLNKLFIASELLHLNKRNWTGLKLGLIEELEAHLHPQSQMQIIESLQEEGHLENFQLIITTHSPNIGSKIKLDSLILCTSNNAFPMHKGITQLEETDYHFLERFLDTTKANLFFAKGVLFVEGWAEEILLPELARQLEKLGIIKNEFTESGVSVVNVGNTAFLRYAKIFLRKEKPFIEIPVAIITDLDLKPVEFEIDKGIIKRDKKRKNLVITGFDDPEIAKHKSKRTYDQQEQSVKTFISNHWTLEYCLARSVYRKLFYKAVLLALLEQKTEQKIRDTSRYSAAVANIDHYFNEWRDTEESIAYEIYMQILGEKQVLNLCKEPISKSIISQQFAKLIEEDIEISKEKIEADQNISYLIEAIKYVTKSN